MKNFIIIGFTLICLSFVTSCSKETVEPYFKSDPSKFSFDRKESKKMFTIKTNEKWSIDLNGMDWLSVDRSEGVGDDEKSQIITITASRNLGDAREGDLFINTSSQQSVIRIEQEGGDVLFGMASFSKPLLPGIQLTDTYIVLPFSRGGVFDPALVTTTITGLGAPGIVVSDFNADLSTETGQIMIPLSGTPTTDGEVSFTLKILGKEVVVNGVVIGNTDPVGTVYLKQDFELLEFGGDQIGGKAGTALVTWGTLEGKNVVPANPAFKSVVSYADGSPDYFRFMHPSYVAMRGLEGWSGLDAYERIGHIKINTGARKDGYIATPALASIQGRVDIKVKFTVAKVNNANVIVEVLNAGTFEDSSMEKEIQLPTSLLWETKEIIVRGATSATVIQFKGVSIVPNVFLLDNVEVSKVDKK